MSKGYDQPDVFTYYFKDHDFGTGSNITSVIAVPLDSNGIGKAGRVIGVTIYDVTENFAGSTLDAGVQVGDGSDADKYYDSGLVLDETVDTTESVYLVDDGAQVAIEAGRTSVTVTFNSATGTPTGIACVAVHIGWY